MGLETKRNEICYPYMLEKCYNLKEGKSMGGKDITEKTLEDYNDVFADIVNGFVFKGESRIDPDDLTNATARSQYKADEKLHEMERDVAKYWSKNNVNIAICGIENQTSVERYMPLRVFGYEGAAYRQQILSSKKEFVPVVTLVLYFGTKERWKQPKTIKEIVDIPNGMEDYVNDCKINVFEIAWLSEEEIERFHSDFRIVANFFAKKRQNKEYIPDDPQEIKHVDALLKLLSVMAGDNRYETILYDGSGKEIKNMCDVAERLENKGRIEGQNDLANAIRELKKGASPEELLKKGYDQNTIDLAIACGELLTTYADA